MLEDTLKEIESTSNWSKGEESEYCQICLKRSAFFCRTQKGKQCVECIALELKKIVNEEKILTWTVSRFKEVLRTEDGLCYRLMILWRFKEIFQLVSLASPGDINELLIYLVWNLGWTSPHPLAQVVREAALKSCIASGQRVLPILFRIYDPKPWQFYANIVLAAGSIAPENFQVKALLEKAVKSPEPGVREYVLRAISSYNSPWSKEILLPMIHDSEPAVRNLATKLAADFKLSHIAKSAPAQLPTYEQVRQMQLFNKNQPKSVPSPLLTSEQEQSKEKAVAIYRTPPPPPLLTREQKQIATIINDSYNADVLKKLYSHYLYHFFEDELIVNAKSLFKKADLIYALMVVYSNKESFQKLLGYFPQDVRQILNLLVWEGGEHYAEKLEKMFNLQIVKKDKYSSHIIHDSYLLFQINEKYNYSGYRYSLYLSEGLRNLFKQYLVPPKEYDLIPIDTIEKTGFVYEDNERILRQLKLFYAYIQQGNLKSAKNSNKLLKSSIKQMVKYCHIEEFYNSEDEELTYIKTQLLASFLNKTTIKSLANSPEILKGLFDDFFSGKDFMRYQLRNLLFHIKGDTDYYDKHENREEKVRQALFNLLKELPEKRWISLENVIKYCFYRELNLEIVNKSAANRYLYYNKAFTNNRYSGYERAEITGENYNDVLVVPLIKAVMYLFASFGIIDMAYNLPENPYFQDKDHNYLCPFDGLKYIKLTKLGAYISGKTKVYQVKFEEEKANIVLDEKRLIIHLEGKDMLKSLVLEKIADRLSDSHYRVDYHSFLKECSSKKDVQLKVTLFKEQICSNPSQIWQEFLDEVLRRINPLKGVQGIRIFKLAQDKELISLIARDEVLKSYILKAEDYHLLIDANVLGKVKKRLVELGYFIDNI
ncbi:MAG: HEAT repeat domain-containing protein [Nitrospirota bacterium]